MWTREVLSHVVQLIKGWEGTKDVLETRAYSMTESAANVPSDGNDTVPAKVGMGDDVGVEICV